MNRINKDFYTKIEIEGQPSLWVETLRSIRNNAQTRDFLKSVYNRERLNIVLTGAGSSAYIGETIEHLFRNRRGISATAIPTTTLVTHFKNYIDTSVPLLLISFARSGNSPESIAAIDIAESYCKDIHHIAITCNENGKLARKVNGMSNGLALILPPESDDQGLAMTGSFTSMMLAAIYLSKNSNRKYVDAIIESIGESADQVIHNYSSHLQELSLKSFDRIIFLGSGPLQGIAEESHLKVQELTDGDVVGKFDSFLGFRHGPKAVVNDNTVLVFLFSSDENVFRYEKDLVREILDDGIAMYCIGVFCDQEQANELDLDLNIVYDLNSAAQASDFNMLLYVLPAQILGFYKSIDLGLDPDSPSKNNTISRVVKGVTIYN